MAKDLTNSIEDRKKILNNNTAIQKIYEYIGFVGFMYEKKYRFTKHQIADYFQVDIRTIERIIEQNKEELIESGYEVYQGDKLKHFKNQLSSYIDKMSNNDVPDINVGNILDMLKKDYENLLKTPQLSIFTYKSFLNIGMLLPNSSKAKQLRAVILDILIDVLNKQLGGHTKYINQREEEFLPSIIRNTNYRQEFTNALDLYIESDKYKYASFTDKIYISIFKENAKEYKKILNLDDKENIRYTMYSEILDLIAGYENGFADVLKRKSEKLTRKLTMKEACSLFEDYEFMTEATLLPMREKARTAMASRDLKFRDAIHEKLKDYIANISFQDYDKFLGESSMEFSKRLEENKDIFKRLKDR